MMQIYKGKLSEDLDIHLAKQQMVHKSFATKVTRQFSESSYFEQMQIHRLKWIVQKCKDVYLPLKEN